MKLSNVLLKPVFLYKIAVLQLLKYKTWKHFGTYQVVLINGHFGTLYLDYHKFVCLHKSTNIALLNSQLVDKFAIALQSVSVQKLDQPSSDANASCEKQPLKTNN